MTEISPDEAKAALLANQQKRREECLKDINEVLKKHSCALDGVVSFRDNQAPRIMIEVQAV